MLCWDADMPDDVARAYAVWDGPAAGNVSETARLLSMRRPTVQDWSQRYRWRERREQQRAEDRDRTIADAYARMVGLVAGALDTVEAAIASRVGADGKPAPGSPTPIALRGAFGVLSRFGIAEVKAVDHTIRPQPAALPYTRADIRALLASGDTATMLALLSGRGWPVPDPASDATAPPGLSPPPPDFRSGQPGGRVVPGPAHPETDDSVFNGRVLDAEVVERGETADQDDEGAL
jgi:hypothetical protein